MASESDLFSETSPARENETAREPLWKGAMLETRVFYRPSGATPGSHSFEGSKEMLSLNQY